MRQSQDGTRIHRSRIGSREDVKHGRVALSTRLDTSTPNNHRSGTHSRVAAGTQAHVVDGDERKKSQKRIYERGGWAKDASAYRGTAPNAARPTPQASLEAFGVRVRDSQSAERCLSTTEMVSRSPQSIEQQLRCQFFFASRASISSTVSVEIWPIPTLSRLSTPTIGSCPTR